MTSRRSTSWVEASNASPRRSSRPRPSTSRTAPTPSARLRLLAMDNLVDIIQLREAVQERDAQVAALTGEVDMWRARALEEHAHRGVEQREAVRRERELVTVLHSELIRNETLSGELAWRRKPWFRRVGRH